MKEIIEKRAARSKTFDMGGGKRQFVERMQPMHFRKDGKWADYAPVWTRAGNNVSLAGMPYTVTISIAQRAYTYSNVLGEQVTSKLLSVGGILTGDLPLDFSNFSVETNRAGFVDVLPQFDLFWVAHYRGLFLQKILKGDSAPRAFEWEVTKDADMDVVLGGLHRGKENIEGVVKRGLHANTYRDLELVEDFTLDRVQAGKEIYTYTQEWTGRVAAVEKGTRVKSWTTDFIYPVRIV